MGAFSHKRVRPFVLFIPMKKVKLTRGYETIISDCDFERVSKYKWHLARRGNSTYVSGCVDGKQDYLHRFIMNCPKGMQVDHRDSDGLNNTRENLRVCTNAENSRNCRPGGNHYKGVYKHSKNGTWVAEICINGIGKYIGSFKTQEEAALAYNNVAKVAYGEFARLNEVRR